MPGLYFSGRKWAAIAGGIQIPVFMMLYVRLSVFASSDHFWYRYVCNHILEWNLSYSRHNNLSFTWHFTKQHEFSSCIKDNITHKQKPVGQRILANSQREMTVSARGFHGKKLLPDAAWWSEKLLEKSSGRHYCRMSDTVWTKNSHTNQHSLFLLK